MPHVFISYAKKDTRPLAMALRSTLRGVGGLTAWMDESLEAGQSWALQIQAEIDRADYVVVLLSPDINRPETPQQRRSFVLNEIDYAQQANKQILPVMVVQTRTPIQIAGVQHIDLTQIPTDPMPVVKMVCARFGLSLPPVDAPKKSASNPDDLNKLLQVLASISHRDPVNGAVSKARSFFALRNSQWEAFVTAFPHLKLPEMSFCLLPINILQKDTKPFWISQTPVTVNQWNTAIAGREVSLPRVKTSTFVTASPRDQAKFAEWLGCRLPTEAELTYALNGFEKKPSSPNWAGLDTSSEGFRVVLTEETFSKRPT